MKLHDFCNSGRSQKILRVFYHLPLTRPSWGSKSGPSGKFVNCAGSDGLDVIDILFGCYCVIAFSLWISGGSNFQAKLFSYFNEINHLKDQNID